jgi:hypothetical protein
MPMRSVPLDYGKLTAAIQAAEYPRERIWIDFKRRLYPEKTGSTDPAAMQADAEAREKVSLELARDLASMAERGGFLVYGVKEDKTRHTFTVDEMPLPVGLHETIVDVARNRITPPLTVLPTLLPNPDTETTGFLVVEIPESPDAPHMANHIYWGRSETGKIRLSDDHVERLMLARSQLSGRLAKEMQATVEVDPIDAGSRKVSHFYFTAVPTRSWPDMFARYTKDHQSRTSLLQRCFNVAEDIRNADQGQRPTAVAFSPLSNVRRTQLVPAGWVNTWPVRAAEGDGRTAGVDDDGPVRYINLGAGTALSIDPDTPLVRDIQLLHETRDMIRLVSALSDEVGYTGSWLFGVQLDRLDGCSSQLADPYVGGPGTPSGVFQAPGYVQSTRASALEVRAQPSAITVRLMQGLLRELGTEVFVSQPPFDQG